MKNKYLYFILFTISLTFIFTLPVSAKQSEWGETGRIRVGDASSKRLKAMQSSLDMLERDMTREKSVLSTASTPQELSTPDKPVTHKTKPSKKKINKKKQQRNDCTRPPCLIKRKKGSSFDIALNRYYFRYAEPDFMKEQDYMHGISLAYNWTNTKDPDAVYPKYLSFLGDKVDLIRLESDFSYGLLDYDSEGTGESQNDPFYVVELRGIAGFDFIDCPRFSLTPYIGLGFRYLKDDSGGKISSTGYYGYDRESRYLYCPIGFQTNTLLFKSIGMKWMAEYDYFIGGKQISHLEDVSSSYSTLSNDQDKGYGVRTSVRLTKMNDHIDFFVEPFVRYWDIEDSELSIITYNGTPYAYGVEPKNNSTEYGFKVGANF